MSNVGIVQIVIIMLVSHIIGGYPKNNRQQSQITVCDPNQFIADGKPSEILQRLHQESHTTQALNILTDTVGVSVVLCLQNSIPFDDLEITSGSSYICGGHGKFMASDELFFKKCEFLGDKQSISNNGPLDFKLPFTYTLGGKVTYHKSYIKLPMARAITGQLSVEFGLSIDLTLHIDSLDSVAEKIQNKECFMHIKHFEGSLFKTEHSMAEIDHPNTYQMCQSRIDSLLMPEVDQMEKVLTDKLQVAFYEALVNSGQWICQDDHVKEVINRKTVNTWKRISSGDFGKHCS